MYSRFIQARIAWMGAVAYAVCMSSIRKIRIIRA